MSSLPPPPLTPAIPREAWEGCSVILHVNDGDRVVFNRLTPRATVGIGGRECSLQPLVGCPFGSVFRVEPCNDLSPNKKRRRGIVSSGRLVRYAGAPLRDEDVMQDTQEQDGTRDNDDDAPQDNQEQEEAKDNRSLVDNNTAQTLSSHDIEAMRRDGLSGDVIVEALIANSSTYGKKTVQSQEKYKLRKQKKHAHKLVLRRPSARSICEAYLKKNPDRTGFMRVDALSLLLSMANVGAYSDVLVVDMVGGLVVGAAAEHLGGTGYVCSTYLGPAPTSIDIIGKYNFSSNVTSRIVQSPFSSLCSLRNCGNAPCVLDDSIQGEMDEPRAVPDEITQSSLAQQVDAAAVSNEYGQTSTKVQEMDLDVSGPCQDGNPLLDCKSKDGALGASKSLKAGKAPPLEKMKYWKEHGFSSLIVAAPEHELESFVADLLPLLSYSAPFAIYHQYLEPLASCMHSLRVSNMAVQLQISEPWLREYQVLSSRTHPHMRTNNSGGYLLSGIRIPDVCSRE